MTESAKVNYIKICIKERLRAADIDSRFGSLTTVNQQVEETILYSLCDTTTDDHFSCHIREPLPNRDEVFITTEELEKIPKKDARKVVNKSAATLITTFQDVWKNLPRLLSCEEFKPLYVTTVTKGIAINRLKEYTKRHIKIINQLMKLLETPDQSIPIQLSQLLSLTFSILLHCHCICELEQKTDLHIHLRRFLSDMVVTFLLLKSVLSTTSYNGKYTLFDSDFPGKEDIEKVIIKNAIHLSLSPENPVFQELVLIEMLNILELNNIPIAWPHEDYKSKVDVMAEMVVQHFKKTRNQNHMIMN